MNALPRIRLVVTVLCLPLMIGCGYITAGGSPEPPTEPTMPSAEPSVVASGTASSLTPSPGATASPTPILSVPSASPTSTAAASPVPRELEASNEFWDPFYDDCYFGPITTIPSSLRDLLDESHAVVRGKIADLRVRLWNKKWEILTAAVTVSDVLMGQPKLSRAGTVEIEIGLGGRSLAELRRLIPEHDHLWFIKGPGDFADTYLTTDYTQVSVLRDIDGVVRVIKPGSIALAYSPTQFPVPLEGTDFEALVRDVRDLTGGSRIDLFAKKGPADSEQINRWGAC